MGLESATYVDGLNSAWPLGGDSRREGDNHVRLLKAVMKATFPGADAAVANVSQAQAEDHTDTSPYIWTPQRVAQAIEDYWAAVSQAQAEDSTNTTTYEWTPQRVHQAAAAAGTVQSGFFAYKSGAGQIISISTWTKATLETESFDINSDFATSRHTPTVAGAYIYAGAGYYDPNSSAGDMGMAIYKNGAMVSSAGLYVTGHGQPTGCTVPATLVQMNGSSDYVELYTFQEIAATEQLMQTTSTGIDSSIITWLSGTRIGA